MPSYIINSLKRKDEYIPQRRLESIKMENLTFPELMKKINDITRMISIRAKQNGYAVDYRFKIINDNINNTSKINKILS